MSCNNNCGGCKCKADKCAVYKIEHMVVDDRSEASYFRNAYVTVRNENAVYHVDGMGNTVTLSRTPIFSDTYTPQVGDYKNNTVYNFAVEEGYVFDSSGNYKIIYLSSGGGVSS